MSVASIDERTTRNRLEAADMFEARPAEMREADTLCLSRRD